MTVRRFSRRLHLTAHPHHSTLITQHYTLRHHSITIVGEEDEVLKERDVVERNDC